MKGLKDYILESLEDDGYKSFEEVVKNTKKFPVDFSKKDAEKAIENGKIECYYWYPVRKGGKIYSSRDTVSLFAEDASDDPRGRYHVYSEVIPLEETVWEDIEHGIWRNDNFKTGE